MRRRDFLGAVAAGAGLAPAQQQQQQPDPILRAMRDEMERARMLKIAALDTPYYLEYSLDESQSVVVHASLGGLIQSRRFHMRIPRVQVRVGDYKFDNGNYIFGDFYSGTRYDSDQWPLDDSYEAFRQQLWLATDRAFKGASEAIARKRAALRNVSQTDPLPDFTKAEPVNRVLPLARLNLDENQLAARARKLSAIFASFPAVISSAVELEAQTNNTYLVTSEGTNVRYPDFLAYWRIRASALAPNGETVRDGVMLYATSPGRIPTDAEVERAIRDMGANLTAMTAAPTGESYAGPVLFEGLSGPQLFAELLGANLGLARRPVSEPGRPLPWMGSELEGRAGARILPEFLDVLDDPTQNEWRGRALLGYTPVDLEGVVPAPVKVVDKGRLTAFLLTRTPAGGFVQSNGRGRLPGPFATKVATPTNLFVTARETSSPAALKKQLLDLCTQRGKKYGYIVRKMDYPSSASFGEVRALATAAMQGGGGARPVSIPIQLYRVYPDGKEELVRGMRFRGLSVRSLKDIVSASDQTANLDYLYNQAPFAVMGAGGYVAPVTVVAPSVLFEDLELEPSRDEVPRPPLVPPPPLSD
jgi:hypothetical protein